MAWLEIYQTGVSNRKLSWIHDRLISLGKPQYSMVADLLISAMLRCNKKYAKEKQLIRNGKQLPVWETRVRIDLPRLAEAILPDKSVDHVKRRRTQWVVNTEQAMDFLTSNKIVLSGIWGTGMDSVYDVDFHPAFYGLKELNLPSPLQVPAYMYRWGRPITFPTYGFMLPRKLMVEQKMHPEKLYPGMKQPTAYPLETFCKITGIPLPSKWRRASKDRAQGWDEWYARCVERAADYFKEYVVGYFGGDSVLVNVSSVADRLK